MMQSPKLLQMISLQEESLVCCKTRPLPPLSSMHAAMGILEKISEIEKEIARTQKNKGEGRPRGASPATAAGGGQEPSGPGGIRAGPQGRVENLSSRSSVRPG